MIDVLERVVERVRAWPPERQAEAAELLIALDEEVAAIDEAMAQVERGDTADPAEVEALFARYRA